MIENKHIELLVGKSGDVPIMILRINGNSDLDQVLSLGEAQQLGTSILMSCGIALERAKVT